MGFSSGTSTRWLYVHCFQVELEFSVFVFVEGGKPENPEKNPRSRNENQQQTQPTNYVEMKQLVIRLGPSVPVVACNWHFVLDSLYLSHYNILLPSEQGN